MRRQQNSIVFIGLLSAFSLLTFDLYQPSLPFITTHLNTTYHLSQLTLSIYLFFFGITHLMWGPLLDHFGRRKLLPGSLILAVIASIICACAPNIYILILGRSLQGFALCCANLIAYSSSRDFENEVERAKVLSYISMIVAVSPIIAPVIGSILFDYLGWQSNFILMAIIGQILLLKTRKSLVESPFWKPTGVRFSFKEALSSYTSILPSPSLWLGSLIMMFSFTAVMLSVINSSYLIIDKLGYSPLIFGIIFMFNGLNIIFGNYLGIWLRDRISMTTSIYIGNGLMILGGLAMFLTSEVYGFSLIALSFSLVSNLGISVIAPPTMSMVLTDFKENSGVAIAVINTVRLIGSATLSILGGYWIAQDHNALPLGLILSGLGALICSWHFVKLQTQKPDEDDIEVAEGNGDLIVG